VGKFLEGADYPASRDDLAAYAESQDAPEEVLETIGALPEKEYASATDVQEAIA